MKKEKAVDVLKDLVVELDTLTYNQEQAFKSKTDFYVGKFLGVSSPVYEKVRNYEIRARIHNQMYGDEIATAINSNRKGLSNLLKSSIQIIEQNGIYKEPKKNLLSDKDNWLLLTIAISIFFFGITIGFWIRQYEILSTLTGN